MSRIGKFIVLILFGFALGGALAYLTQERAPAMPEVPAAEQTADVAALTADPAAIAIEGAPEMPAIDTPAPDAENNTVAGSSVGGAFALQDFNGNDVTEKSWPGKMKLVFFGFTSCPDICPAALEKVTAALKISGTDKVQPLFITVDPARDTGEAMKAYLANYDASYVGLTGSEEQLKAAQDAYKVYASKQEPVSPEHAEHYNVDHSGYIYLIGGDEQLLEIFGKDATADAIAAAIAKHGVVADIAPVDALMPEDAPMDATPEVTPESPVTMPEMQVEHIPAMPPVEGMPDMPAQPE
jgi:protein SCO1/2